MGNVEQEEERKGDFDRLDMPLPMMSGLSCNDVKIPMNSPPNIGSHAEMLRLDMKCNIRATMCNMRENALWEYIVNLQRENK